MKRREIQMGDKRETQRVNTKVRHEGKRDKRGREK